MHTDPQKLQHRLEDAGFEPRVATALSEVITELRDQKRAREGDGSEIATFHDLNVELKAFKREFKLALVIQALAITLVVTTLLRLLP